MVDLRVNVHYQLGQDKHDDEVEDEEEKDYNKEVEEQEQEEEDEEGEQMDGNMDSEANDESNDIVLTISGHEWLFLFLIFSCQSMLKKKYKELCSLL